MSVICLKPFLGRRFAWLLCVALPVASVWAQERATDPELAEEFKYIDLLQQNRMPDIADEVIADVKKRFPEAAAQLKVREIQGLLWQAKFDEVKKVIAAIPDKNSAEYWALTLAMADALYAYSKYADADRLYLEFFKKVDKPPAALVSFYRDSAYKYAQMLLYVGKEREALEAFKRLFKVPLEEDVARNVQADMAELMLKLAPDIAKKEDKAAMLKEAEALVDKLLWKQDIWFGKAIVMKAHIAMLRGDVKGAQELVENYMPQLRIIHDSLRESDKDGSQGLLRMSPMPQCRYLLAVLLMNEAMAEVKKEGGSDDRIKDLLLGERDPQTKARKTNGAFHHFINVFIRFPESQWAAEAGERSETIRKLIKDRFAADLGTRVTPEQMRKVEQMQFAGARLVFSQNQFKEAAEKYLLVLNQFPESPDSVSALGDLAVCYAELSGKDPDALLLADTVTGHLSERFSANTRLMKEAGDQVRRIGEHYGELKMEDKKREAYATFFRDYPTHYAAGQLVMSFGEREFQNKNYKGALVYYRQIAEIYTNSPYYFDALNRTAQVYKEEGDRIGEIQTLDAYVTKLAASERPGHALVVGRFRLADAQREYGIGVLRSAATNATPEAVLDAQTNGVAWLVRAGVGFGAVSRLLADSPAAYQSNDEEKKRNDQMREMAVFTRALCLSQIQHPPDKIELLRKAAIAAFEEYVKLYPEGKHASKALLQVATLYTIMPDVAKAQAAFEKLSKDYPNSEEAKNSVPSLAKSLIEMGLRGEGVAKYREMLAAGGKYTEMQFMDAAQALEGAKEFDLALQAYDKVLASAKEISVSAVAKLGRARALMGQKKFGEACKLLGDFTKDKELSKLLVFVDANLLLVEAASEEGKTEKDDNARTLLFNQAVDALKTVKRYRTEPEQQRELDLAAGEVLVRKMEAEKKMGLTDKAAVSRGNAIVAFKVLVDTIEPGNVKLAAIQESAYAACLPLLLEHKAFGQTQEMCERYLASFPNGRYTTDVRNWLQQAKIGP